MIIPKTYGGPAHWSWETVRTTTAEADQSQDDTRELRSLSLNGPTAQKPPRARSALRMGARSDSITRVVSRALGQRND
jgi:hypothetical protein